MTDQHDASGERRLHGSELDLQLAHRLASFLNQETSMPADEQWETMRLMLSVLGYEFPPPTFPYQAVLEQRLERPGVRLMPGRLVADILDPSGRQGLAESVRNLLSSGAAEASVDKPTLLSGRFHEDPYTALFRQPEVPWLGSSGEEYILGYKLPNGEVASRARLLEVCRSIGAVVDTADASWLFATIDLNVLSKQQSRQASRMRNCID